MKEDVKYITIDGRGEHESFRDCITQTLKDLKTDEGIHLIKDFEPFPIYQMMGEKGFEKHMEKINEEEFHVYFWRKEKLEKITMSEHLQVDEEKIKKIMEIKLQYLKDNISLEKAKEDMKNSFEKVTAQEFAICEQYLQQYGISDEVLAERMDEILEIFGDILVTEKLSLPNGHPIRTYLDEVEALREVLAGIK